MLHWRRDREIPSVQQQTTVINIASRWRSFSYTVQQHDKCWQCSWQCPTAGSTAQLVAASGNVTEIKQKLVYAATSKHVLLEDTSWWPGYFRPKRLANSCMTDSKRRTHAHARTHTEHRRRVKQCSDPLWFIIFESKLTSRSYCVRGYQSYALSPYLCSPANQMQWGITRKKHTVAQKNAPYFHRTRNAHCCYPQPHQFNCYIFSHLCLCLLRERFPSDSRSTL